MLKTFKKNKKIVYPLDKENRISKIAYGMAKNRQIAMDYKLDDTEDWNEQGNDFAYNHSLPVDGADDISR